MSEWRTAWLRNAAEVSCGASTRRFDSREQTADTRLGVTTLSHDDDDDDDDDAVSLLTAAAAVSLSAGVGN